jgi:hypothetical protein
VQDDFLDFAATPEQLDRIGTEIVNNKCSWCITALFDASPEQREVLDAGIRMQRWRVKALFEDVGLREKYRAYKETKDPRGNIGSDRGRFGGRGHISEAGGFAMFLPDLQEITKLSTVRSDASQQRSVRHSEDSSAVPLYEANGDVSHTECNHDAPVHDAGFPLLLALPVSEDG